MLLKSQTFFAVISLLELGATVVPLKNIVALHKLNNHTRPRDLYL